MFQSLPLATKKIWENLGRLWLRLRTLNLADHARVIPSCCQFGTNSPTKSCSSPPDDTRYAHPNPKISIASHEIPWHPLFIERRDGQTNAGAAIDPEQGEKRQAHTGNRLRLTIKRDPARKRADISPRWQARRTPSDGTVGGSGSGSNPVRLFHFRGLKTPAKRPQGNGE